MVWCWRGKKTHFHRLFYYSVLNDRWMNKDGKGKVYRAVVLNLNHESVSVRYIDYGNKKEEVSACDLYRWDPLLEVIPPQAIRVRLGGISDNACSGFHYSKKQVDVFREVMLRNEPYNMVVLKRLELQSSVFCHSLRLSGPEVEVSLTSKSDVNIVTTLLSYPVMSGVFSEELPNRPGPFQASLLHLDGSSSIPPPGPPNPSQAIMPTQPTEEKVSSWLEGLHSADCGDQMANEKLERPMSRTPEEHKNEEEPMLVEGEGNNPIVGKLTGDQKQNIAPKSALRLEQQVIELDENRQFRWLLASISNPGEIWLHPVQETSYFLGEVEASLVSSAPQRLDQDSIAPIGSCWAVPSTSDSIPLICSSTWVRVRVENYVDDLVFVRSIDYGVLMETSKEDLHHLPQGPASTLPGIGVCCSLAGVLPPTSGWTEQDTAAALGMMDFETIRLGFIPNVQKGGDNLEVVLYTLNIESGVPNLLTTTLNDELLRLDTHVPEKHLKKR